MKHQQLAQTYLSIEEIDALASGLARLAQPDAPMTTARAASRIVYAALPLQHPMAPVIRSLATHLAELRSQLDD